MPDKKISELVDGGDPQDNDEFVVARGGDNNKLAWSSLSAAATAGNVALTLSGNTAGVPALVSSGTVTLAGGNNITVSQVGNAITISGASIPAESQSFIGGISASDTLYTSGSVRISGSGAATVKSGTGQLVIVDVATQSVQPETQTFIGGVRNSETTYTSGTVRLSELGAVTIRSTTGNAFQISVNSQSVQPETQTFIAGVSASDTLYTSGNVRITGVGGGVTVSSNTGQRIDISVAAQSVQPETQTFIGAIRNSETTYTSGTVRLSELGAVTIRSTTGQAFQISVNSQSVQPETQTFIAGVSASDTLYTSGNVRITGVGGGVTVSSNTGQRVDISVAAPVAQTAQTGISGIANSQTTYTSGTVSLSELGAITIRSTTGNQYQLSVNSQTVQTQGGFVSVGVSTGGNTAGNTTVNTGSRLVIVGSNGITASQGTAAGATTITLSGITQSVQPETQTFVGGIANSQTTYTSGTVSLSELGAITVRSTTGNQFQLSVNSQTAQTQGILAVGASTGGNTAGDTGVASGTRLVFVGSNNITVSQGTAANATTLTISGPTAAAQTVQTQGILNVALSNVGNTAGDTGINSGTRYVLAGGNGITLSGSSAANATTVTISGITQSVQTQGGFASLGVSTGGNTAGNTQVSTGSRFVLVGSGNLTLSQATAAGASTVTLSVAAQSVQPETQTFIGGISASDTLYTSGTVRFTGSNMITVKSSGAGQTVILDATQSVQTNDIPRLGVSTGGNTAGDTTVNSGTRFVLVGTNMISLSQTTGASATTISINATQSAQTQSNIQALYDGANSISTGTVRLTNANGVSFSVNAQTLSASVNESISMFAVSNTTQNTSGTAHKSALSFGGAGVASVGVTGGSVVVSVPAGGGAGFSAGVSTGGNTAGATGVSGTQLVLVGNNNISLSQTTGANGLTISINGDDAASIGVSTGGNTAGATGVTGTQMVLVGVSPMSLSQTTGAAGGTISINAPATSSISATGALEVSTNGSTISLGVPSVKTMADWQNMPLGVATLVTGAQAISKTPFYWGEILPGKITLNSLAFRVSFVTTATLQSFSVHAGIYTHVNSTSMALLGSWSESYVLSTASSASWSGIRNIVLTGQGTHTNLSVLTGGDYMFGLMASAGASQSMNFSWMGAGTAGGPLGRIVPGANQNSTGTSQGVMGLIGRGSTTVNALPANVVASEVVNQGQGASMQMQPWVYIRS